MYTTSNSCGTRATCISYKEKGGEKYSMGNSLMDNDWAVFYYLLAYCKWNSFAREDHYYIYKNAFTKTDIAKTLGITRPTIDSCLMRLNKEGIISDNKDAFIIYVPNVYLKIGQDVLRYLISLYNKGEGAYYIRGCTALYAYSLLVDSNQGFTVNTFAKMLGCPENKDQYLRRAEATLWFLKGRGFIDFDWKTSSNTFGNSFTVFYLKDIHVDAMPTRENIVFEKDVPQEAIDNVVRLNQDFKNQIVIELGDI